MAALAACRLKRQDLSEHGGPNVVSLMKLESKRREGSMMFYGPSGAPLVIFRRACLTWRTESSKKMRKLGSSKLEMSFSSCKATQKNLLPEKKVSRPLSPLFDGSHTLVAQKNIEPPMLPFSVLTCGTMNVLEGTLHAP